MTVNELKTNISKGKIENVYLFSGPEIGEKNEVVSMIEKIVFKDAKPVIYNFYCANDFDPVDFVDTFNSNLLFSEKKMVVLKNIELANKNLIGILEHLLVPKKMMSHNFEKDILHRAAMKNKEKDFTAFYKKDNDYYSLKEDIKDSEYKKIIALFDSIGFSNIDKNTFLIMLNESNDKIPAGITNILSSSQHVIFWEMFDNQKPGWVRMEFKKYNLFVDDSAVEFILDMIENNKYFLENEIQRISICYDSLKKNDKNVITREIIEEYLYHSKEETSFTLFSSLLDKNLSKALDILEKIFYSDDESLLNGLLWSLRRFLRALDLFENQNMAIEEIYSTLQIMAKKGKEELNIGLKNYKYQHISIMFYYLSELDYYLKIFPDDLKLVKLQEFIINFIIGDIKNSFLTGDLITFQIGNIY